MIHDYNFFPTMIVGCPHETTEHCLWFTTFIFNNASTLTM